MAERVETYVDSAGEHRWRRRAANGEIVSQSSEGYRNRGHALAEAARRNPGVEVVDEAQLEAEQDGDA